MTPARTSGVEHEVIADRQHVLEVVLVQKGEGVLANVLDDVAALGDGVLRAALCKLATQNRIA
jgi:hypothetical protein